MYINRVAQKNVYTLAAVRRLRQCLDADGGHFEHLHWIQNWRTSLISILLLYKYSSYDYRVIFFMSKCVYIFGPHTHTFSLSLYIYIYVCVCVCIYMYIYIYIYRVSHELRSLLRESVPSVKIYRYNPKHLYPKLNGYGDNGQRSLKLWQLLHTYWLANTY